MSTWYDQYMRNLTAINRARIQMLGAQGSATLSRPGPQDIALQAINNAKPTYGRNLTGPQEPPKKKGDNQPWYLDIATAPWDAAETVLDTSPARAILDVLSRGTYASAGYSSAYNKQQEATAAKYKNQPNGPRGVTAEVMSWLRPAFTSAPYEEAWKGLKGEDKETYADVIREQHPNAGKWTRGLGGFGLDVAADPTTYIPVAGAAKIVGQAFGRGKAAIKPTEAIVESVAKGEPVAAKNSDLVAKILEAPKPTQTSTVKVAPTVKPEDIVNTTRASQITDALKGVPAFNYPRDLDIPAPFKEVEEAVPDAPKVAESATDPRKAKLASARAVKLSILQNEDYLIGGKHRVGDLLKAARSANEEQAKLINTMIDQEAKNIVKKGTFENLGEYAQMYGRSGKKTAFGLTVPQLQKLFQEGRIGAGTGKSEFLEQFPIASVDDLDNVFVNTAMGDRVSLKEYLERLNIPIKSVSAKGVEKDVILEKFDLTKAGRGEYKKAVAAEPIKRKVEKKFAGPEAVTWLAQHTPTIGKEGIAYLGQATSRADFADRLTKLKAKTMARDFTSFEQFMAAAKAGAIPKETMNSVLSKIGVQNLAELEKKAKATIPAKAQAKPTELKPAPAQVKLPPKIERIVGKAPDTFAVQPAEASIAKGVVPADRGKHALSENQMKDLAKALPWSVLENIVDPTDIKKYPFLTDVKRSKRTSNTPGKGRARNIYGWHSISQADVFRSLVRSAGPRHKVEGVKGGQAAKAWRERAKGMYDDVVPSLRAAEAGLESQGVKLISGIDNSGLLMSLGDVLTALPREIVEKHLFNPRTSALPTEFMEAADSIVRSLMGKIPLDVARVNAFNLFKNSAKIKQLKDSDKVAGELTRALLENSDTLLQIVENNYARYGAQIGESVRSMTDEVIDNVIKKFANPDISIGEAFGDFVMRAEDISKIGQKIKAPAEAVPAAKETADATLATVLRPGDFAEAKAAQKFAKVANEKEAAKVGVEQSKSRGVEALDLIDRTVDLGDRYQTQLAGNLFRANVPLLDKVHTMKDALGRAFVSDYGHKALHESLRMERSVTQHFARAHRGLIAQLSDSIHAVAGENAAEYTREAFKHLQASTTPQSPEMVAIVNGLKSSIDLTFGSSVDNVGSFAQRNGIFAGHLNEILDYYKVDSAYRFNPSKPFKEQAEAWREWEDVTDPLAVLDGMHAAMQRASVEVTLGRTFSSEFGTATKQPGYVKIANSGNKSRIGRFIDTDLYFPKEIAQQLTYLDDVLKGSIAGIENPTTAKVINVYDDIIHAWKSGMTIYRPGHHVRNLIGDVTLSFFDGVKSPRVYAKAVRIMSKRSKAYDGWDGLKALQENRAMPGGETGNIRVSINKKKIKLTDDQIWRAAFKQGIIPDYRTLEDIAFNTKQSVQFKAGKGISLTRPTGGWLQRSMGGLSQSRDHMVRIAHFIDILEKGNFKTADEAFDHAGARVRKWHPDGSDLTNFENKVMRRAFMFYSWMRKAIPLVVETLVMQPGKAIIFPKAMYNFAETMGVDLESLSNPFPVDQLFPEFITDQVLGPQWGEAGNYMGSQPGEPVTELLSQWGSSDPQHGLLGALTPVARIPMEVATGTSLGTGAQIQDTSDYVDQQIPGVGYIARGTGHSVTGLGEPTRDVQKGYTESGSNNMVWLNFLTGLGITDYSKPNYIKRAEIELRNKIGQEMRNG